MVLREGSQGLSIKGKTESFPRELWGVVGQASGLPPGFGVSVGLGSTDFLVCQACTRGLGALQVSHIPVPDIAAPSFFFFSSLCVELSVAQAGLKLLMLLPPPAGITGLNSPLPAWAFPLLPV